MLGDPAMKVSLERFALLPGAGTRGIPLGLGTSWCWDLFFAIGSAPKIPIRGVTLYPSGIAGSGDDFHIRLLLRSSVSQLLPKR